MLRHTLAVAAFVGLSAPAHAATWADGLFEELARDFGTVARGPVLEHPFRFTNTTGQTVQITDVRVSCGCVTASVATPVVAPGGAATVLAQMDTRRFTGPKTVTVYVQFARPGADEVRLSVTANSRDDVTVSPDGFAFGQVARGNTPTAAVNVTLLGGQFAVTGASTESNYLQAGVREVSRNYSGVTYEATVRLRHDTPVGKWFTDLWLTTNHPSAPKVRVPLTVEVLAPLTATPAAVAAGSVPVGSPTERKVIVRGSKPFRITEVRGGDGTVVAKAGDEAKAVHVLSVTVKPAQAGQIDRTLTVVTDMPQEGVLAIPVRAVAVGN